MGGDGGRSKFSFWQYTKPKCNTCFIHIGYASRTQMPWLPWDRGSLQWKALEGEGLWLRCQDGRRKQTAHNEQELHVAACPAASSLHWVGQSVYLLISSLNVFSGWGIVYICGTCTYIVVHIYLCRCIHISVLVRVFFSLDEKRIICYFYTESRWCLWILAASDIFYYCH